MIQSISKEVLAFLDDEEESSCKNSSLEHILKHGCWELGMYQECCNNLIEFWNCLKIQSNWNCLKIQSNWNCPKNGHNRNKQKCKLSPSSPHTCLFIYRFAKERKSGELINMYLCLEVLSIAFNCGNFIGK